MQEFTMPDYKYLIVGGGMTAAAAVDGIRETDANGFVGIISAETHPPYNRPPLSKGLWKGKPLEKNLATYTQAKRRVAPRLHRAQARSAEQEYYRR